MKAGLTGVEIAATTLDNCDALPNEREKLIVEYATTLTKDTNGVTDDLRARLKDQFNDAELVNLTLVIGLYNLTGRFLRSLNIEVEDVFQQIPAATASA
jgi:alkylhydroperoxidase family enzyme